MRDRNATAAVIGSGSVVTLLGLAVLLAAGTLPAVYLGVLALMSFRNVSQGRGRTASEPRFAVLIPAHDEETTLPTLLDSISSIDYPSGLVSVYVVADNCDDHTAEVARRRGAIVMERTDPSRLGKGAALNALIPAVLSSPLKHDALVFLDADSVVGPAFLRAMAESLTPRSQVLQGVNLINRDGSRVLSTLKAVGCHLVCELRPLAYTAMDVSAGLHGNGMCFSRRMVESISWDETSVVEDASLHLLLVSRGVRVTFVPGARVISVVPDAFGAAYGQTVRWERGKVDLFGPALNLVASGVRARDRSQVVAGLDVLLPPFAVVAAVSAAGVLLGWACSDPIAIWLGLLATAGCTLYVGRGVGLAKLDARTALITATWAPVFLAWKLFVVARVVAGGGRGVWARSER